jgi:HEPN domain-containing protein
LKAFLVHQGSDLSKTHDLVALLAQCVGHEASLNALETDCRKLTSYGVTARYPDDLFEPGEERWPRGRGGGLPSPPENPHTLTDRPLAFSNS